MDTQFTENWYAQSQLEQLAAVAKQAPAEGVIIEVGCWEGRSTIALAQAIAPRYMTAIDHWQGNTSEGPEHESVKAAQERDVYQTFLNNMAAAGVAEQVWGWRADWRTAFVLVYFPRIAFAHLDASHDYESTRDLIAAVKARLVPGGIICGDDYATANAGRADLRGGVERAVKELLPGAQVIGNFWAWAEDGRVVLA